MNARRSAPSKRGFWASPEIQELLYLKWQDTTIAKEKQAIGRVARITAAEKTARELQQCGRSVRNVVNSGLMRNSCEKMSKVFDRWKLTG